MVDGTPIGVVPIGLNGDVPPPGASVGGGLNGTYLATSNGEWAKTDDRFHSEATVQSSWTIVSTCSSAAVCSGRVSSDQGWSAEITRHNVEWVVKRDVANWERCPDGSAATGHQLFRFYPADADGIVSVFSTTYLGLDTTTGPSGACGRSQWLNITMPFKLVKPT